MTLAKQPGGGGQIIEYHRSDKVLIQQKPLPDIKPEQAQLTKPFKKGVIPKTNPINVLT